MIQFSGVSKQGPSREATDDHSFSCCFQPLTELPEKKCRRCGLYEHNTFKPDDVFDEWELCRSSFVDGKYVRLKHNEFNATFVCPQCTAFGGECFLYVFFHSDHTSAFIHRSHTSSWLCYVGCWDRKKIIR